MGRMSLLALGCAVLSGPALANPVRLSDAQLNAITAGADVTVTNLVADVPGQAPNVDPNLVNAWGLAASATGPLWVANEGSGTSTVYQANGTPTSTVVSIPAPGGGPGKPTGLAFNGNPDFVVSAAGKSGPSSFLFATEDGTIEGWNGSVNPGQAVIAVNQSAQGAVFKGLTIAQVGGADQLFAADFGNNRVEVFNSTFQPIGQFTDSTVPAGYAPFNVQNINGNLYVSFALQDPTKHIDVAGPGNGFVDVFTPAGKMVSRLASGGALNAPWGLVLAPASMGLPANTLLVGNFGDGKVNAFNSTTGAPLGPLTSNGQPLSIDGLWALRPTQGNTATLTFSAGPNRGQNGLVGTISAVPTGMAQAAAPPAAAAVAPAPAAAAAPAPAPTPAPVAMPMAAPAMMAASAASTSSRMVGGGY